MTKKQKVIVGFVALLAIFIVAAASSFVFAAVSSKQQDNPNSQGASVSSNISNEDPITIPLGEKSNSSSGGLSVDNSTSTGINLGPSSSTNNTANSRDPSNPQDFRQYEQYKDSKEVYFGEIIEGNGAVAQKDNQLAVTYKGYLTNGSMFDQSRVGANGQKEPLIFTLGSGQLIAGFEQGVAGMKAGGSRRIIIPPALGYGDQEQNGIPANSVLIFDVQLLTVQ